MMQNEMNQGTWAGSAAQTAGPGMNGMAAGSWTGNGNPAGDIWQQNPSGCRPAPVPGPVETEETRRFRENYSFFALVEFLYALF